MDRPVQAVFLDVGGPLYPDENFVAAAVIALNELRSTDGVAPVSTTEVTMVFDFVRNTEGASMRKTFAAEFLGDEKLATMLHAAIAPHWRHPAGTLYSDVVPFLTLVSPHVRVGIVANQEQETKDALIRDGVAPFIQSWGLSGLVGKEKPSPEFFEWALHDLGIEAAEALHVGNRFDTDVLPAHSLGLRTAWILRGEAPDEPPAHQLHVADFVAHDLSELGHLLAPLLERSTAG
jgi:putative hydrolase of the HAD superfamily